MFVAYSDKHLPHEPKQIIFSGRIFDSVEVPARATELAASPRCRVRAGSAARIRPRAGACRPRVCLCGVSPVTAVGNY